MRKHKLGGTLPQRDVESSLEGYVVAALNGVPASERGEYLCDCPQCGKRKLYVNVVSGLAHCFHADCLYSAHLAKLIQDVDGCDISEARKRAHALLDDDGSFCNTTQCKNANETETRNDTLARFTTYLANGTHKANDTVLQNANDTQCTIPPGCVPITSQYAKRAVNYLRARGVADDTMLDYVLQFCISPQSHEHERYRSHIVFPFYETKKNGTQKLVYWTTRRTYETKDTHLPKSYHPSGIPKPNIIGAQYVQGDDVFIVEGPMDMLAFPYRAIPLLGSSMTEQTARALCKRYKSITLMLDNDARRSRVQCAEILLRYANDASIACYVLVPRTDPADMMCEIPGASLRIDTVQAQRVRLELSMLHQLYYL